MLISSPLITYKEHNPSVNEHSSIKTGGAYKEELGVCVAKQCGKRVLQGSGSEVLILNSPRSNSISPTHVGV